MPIYEYHCSECGENFEEFQKITDEPVTKCPKCQKNVKRIISQTNFSLKGNGWYKDGYASKKNDSKSEPCTECPSKSECPAKKSDK